MTTLRTTWALLLVVILAPGCTSTDHHTAHAPGTHSGSPNAGTGAGSQVGLVAFRAAILHFLEDPAFAADGLGYEFFEDGILLVKQGRVEAVGAADKMLKALPDGTAVHDRTGKLIVPGFVDTHIHYPQTDMIASYGEQLLEWLETYTFPTERQFGHLGHAQDVAGFFLDELLRNGTTTALVFGTVHPESVDAFFAEAGKRNLRMVSGKVMMDRNAPDYLLDTAESSYQESKALIERWHGKGRLSYAVTPRFAPTSTEAQLERAGQLLEECDDCFLHTHVAENLNEVAWVKSLFPGSESYLGVYREFGLIRERSVFAHAIHLEQRDYDTLAENNAAIAFCPTSNLFLGSGLFDLQGSRERNVRVGMGTDVGAGTSFSMLQTLNEAYKVLQLQQQNLSAYRALYLATLGGAQALHLENVIGNFETGKEADFVVLNFDSTPLMVRRHANAQGMAEKLFVLIMLGDDRSVDETYVMGESIYQK